MPAKASPVPSALFVVFDGLVERVCSAAAWLSIPIMLALALQWPLRDWLGRYSREVNDLGQCLFALYVAVGVTAASRAGAHLAAHAGAGSGASGTSTGTKRASPWLRRMMMLAGVAPWCAWVLWQGAALTARSVASLERFPDTFNQGYFVIKLATWLLALLMLLHTLMEATRPREPALAP